MSDALTKQHADKYERPLVAVDVVACTVLDADLKVLLIRRGLDPPGWALPGGFVRCEGGPTGQGEDLDEAARRELLDETRLPVGGAQTPLVQVHVFGAADRDPRARVISVAYLAVVKPELAAFVRAGSDAAGVQWWSVSDLKKVTLAFDHALIVERALERLRVDVEDTSLARALVPETFTVAELRAALDAVHGKRSDPANFRRRFKQMIDAHVVVEATGRRVTGRRPAQVFAFR